jgi:Flp pilus assembly protein TadG
MRGPLRAPWLGDQRGAAAVETAIVAPFLFMAVIGMFDLGVLLFRWNQAVEATRVGARLAAVSDPVSTELSTMTGLETGVQPGDPAGTYERLCAAGGQTCTGGTYGAPAFSRIFHGPGSAACGDAGAREQLGMCDAFSQLQASHVSIRYRNSGVDSAGVAGALRPLITVRVSGAPSGVSLLGQMLPALLTLPDAETTVVAEDMKSAG